MRVLLVSSRFPLPPWRGNQLRTVQWLDALTEHRCLLVCPGPDADTESATLAAEIRTLPGVGAGGVARAGVAAARGRPAQEGLYDSRRARRVVADAVRDWRPDVAVIQMVRCGWAAGAVASVDPDVPLLFDAIDCMAMHYERTAAAAPVGLRTAYRLEARRCRRREAELVRQAALSCAVSSRDLSALGAAPTGRVVPVAGSVGSSADPRWSGEPVVLLSGNLGYRPTVRAALWFADCVWPGVRRRVPAARWLLAGARPAPAVRRLADRPGIEVHGDVDDLASFLGRARLAIAPMTTGSGVPLKIVEALAAGVPVVADPWPAAGLEDPSAVVAADGDAAWLEAVVGLLEDAEAVRRQRALGLETWRAHYHPERIRQRIRDAVESAAGSVER
ncbi:MAG: glycosyltransferase family 4 protein [Holophagae bacterium]|jgi:hypothetical protein